MPEHDPYVRSIEQVVPPVLTGLELLGQISRHLNPTTAGAMAEQLSPHAEALATAHRHLQSLTWPDELVFFRDRLDDAAAKTYTAMTSFIEASANAQDMMGLFRSVRKGVVAQEAVYPLAQVLAPVSRFFLEPERRDDQVLLERLAEAAVREADPPVGILHAANARDERGGYSLYVPEYYDDTRRWPLIITLHGGSGHGRDSLWGWLREARSRGALVLSPTSRDRTWSIIDEDDIDIDNLKSMIDTVRAHYAIDERRILLGGMSDGATYALLAGLYDDVPFTHLAPSSGVLHPMIMMTGAIHRAADLPVYLMHGTMDWMFPIDMAHMTRDTLQAAGARLTWREIPDLAHTYPREENVRILDWLDDEAARPDATAV